MLYPRGIPSHVAGTCQVCDMFADVEKWGPPIGGVTVHLRLPHDAIGAPARPAVCRCTVRTVCLTCLARLDEWE